MNDTLGSIAKFIDEHHVMSLATAGGEGLRVCSLFYAYDAQKLCFVVASDKNTQHIKNIHDNNIIAGNIVLETEKIGKIQGLQFQGKFFPLKDKALQKLYFKKFPYAVAMLPELWQIEVSDFKMTDNRLGFGKKLIWP